MPDHFDLSSYLARIGWAGRNASTPDALASLMHAHMAAIPFENLDVLLGRPVRLDLASLQAKLVHAQRGGYCFEHTTLFAAALKQLGLPTRQHSARVVLITPRAIAPRTHMLLTAVLDGETYVIDPGFGSIGPSGPVLLAPSTGPPAGGLSHVMVRDDDHWVLRARTSNGWIDAWVTNLEDSPPVDFEVANHFTATHRDSPFVNRLMLRAIIPDGYVSVMNRDVTVHRSGVAQKSTLTTRADLSALLRTHFGFDLPEVTRLRVPMIPEWN